MRLLYLILTILVILGMIIFVGPPEITSAQATTRCLDYHYKVILNTAPATLDFYKTTGEFFKTVPSINKEIDTELHCGYSYNVRISASGYQDYTEVYEVKSEMPIVPETRNINLIPIGGVN